MAFVLARPTTETTTLHGAQCLFLRKYSKKVSVSEVSSLIWNIALYGIEASYSY